MTEKKLRTLPVEKQSVQCLPSKSEDIEKCRFCVHSVYFIENGKEIKSPARAYCTMSRSTESVNLKKVEEVVCDDDRKEGFRSIMNIIS
ncbi:hypothetical protein J2128_000764 [Methanomicrobium sp. W14]|uniref:hypothetical protein n=1 Tax=Methanomicrobium sp. W14 TaxID=2817839 RepID=UPI001AE6D18D|nr:hypothetical protein [Methanomicrobium sp. W14]MBP2132843.1 hypothetical protein [Methanomicrobium sp. W14]